MELGEVTLVKGCMICHEEVILMATRRIKKAVLPEKGSILPEVCSKCKEKYLKEGILLINPNNGRLVVLKEDAFKRIFSNTSIPPKRIAFAEDAVLDKFQR